MAILAGISNGAMQAYAAGRRQMSLKAIHKVARALRCEPEVLIGDARIKPARTEAERIAGLKEWRRKNPKAGYQYLKRWRDTHMAEDLRRDKLYKQLKRKGPWRDAWLKIFAYYEGKCLSCKVIDDVIADHVKPLSQGGDNHPGNLQPLCLLCNGLKARTTKDFRPDKGEWCRSLMSDEDHKRMAENTRKAWWARKRQQASAHGDGPIAGVTQQS